MGNILLTIPGVRSTAAAQATHRKAVAIVTRLKHQHPSRELDTPYCQVAAFPRIDGSGGKLVSAPESGDWIAVVGTWFHRHGFSAGSENQLLARYAEVGAETLAQELDGFFVIAIGTAMRREVTIITDAVGTLHCYSRELDDATVICTSSLALAALADVTLDPVGCQEFLQTAAIYETRTFYREVGKLDAARCHVFRIGGTEVNQYWRATDLAADSLDGEVATNAFVESMLAGARRISAAFPQPAIDLTGGYDSRTAVAAFAASGVQFDTVVGGEPDHHDVIVANSLARKAGFSHHNVRPGMPGSYEELQSALDLTDGEWDLVEYARVLEIHRHLADRFDISVNGYSGEIGRGYGWEVLAPNTGERRPLDASHIARKRMLNSAFDASLVAPELRIDSLEHFTGIIARLARGLESLPNTVQYDYVMTLTRCQRWYGRIASSTNQIWPCLSIFLLLSIIRPMLETNTRSRRNSALFRHALQRMSPVLASQPLADGYPPAPLTLANLHRFWPVLQMYGGKAVGRIRRKLPGAKPAASIVSGARGRLAGDVQIRELMRPSRMRSASLFDHDMLGPYIDRMFDPAALAPSQWSLVLTLECTLSRLQELRNEANQIP